MANVIKLNFWIPVDTPINKETFYWDRYDTYRNRFKEKLFKSKFGKYIQQFIHKYEENDYIDYYYQWDWFDYEDFRIHPCIIINNIKYVSVSISLVKFRTSIFDKQYNCLSIKHINVVINEDLDTYISTKQFADKNIDAKWCNVDFYQRNRFIEKRFHYHLNRIYILFKNRNDNAKYSRKKWNACLQHITDYHSDIYYDEISDKEIDASDYHAYRKNGYRKYHRTLGKRGDNSRQKSWKSLTKDKKQYLHNAFIKY